MPAFSPTIGKFGDVTPRGKPWVLWYKRHRRQFYVTIFGLALISLVGAGWWLWYGRSIPAPGGTLDEGIVGYPQRLNPLYSQQNEVDAEITPLIFRGLVRYNQDNQLVPDLAEKIEPSQDGKTYHISLGKHQWHDGTAVSAQDVAFTIGLTQDQGYHGPWSGSFTDVSIKIEDPQHLTLTLKEPYAPFEQNLTIGLLPQHLLGGISAVDLAHNPFNLKPVGTGKLQFTSLQMDPESKQISQLRFHLVDGYLENITYHFYGSLQDAMTDFKLGRLHTLWSQYDRQLEYLSDFNKQEVYTTLNGQTYGLFFNTQDSNVSDGKVRQSLALALPKQQAIKKVFKNHAEVANNVYTPDHWAYSDAIETYAYNLDEAQKRWDEAESKPESITLLIPDLPIHQAMAKEIATAWKKLGLDIKIESKDSVEVGQSIDSGTGYDVVLLGEKVNRDPDRYNNWHSTQTPPTGLNISRLKNDRVDKALEDARRLTKPDERKVKYATFQDYLAREAAVIWLYRPQYVYMWSNKVHGIKISKTWSEQDRFATLEKWYINLAKR